MIFIIFNLEPCETNNFIDNWKRSVAYEPDNPNLCDSFLLEDWYRVISGAGELMPTECPIGGWRCGTTNPIWLSKGSFNKIVNAQLILFFFYASKAQHPVYSSFRLT